MDDTEYLPSEEDLQASHIQGTRDRERSVQLVHFQTVILFVQIRLQIRILPSTSKKIKKDLDFCSFVTLNCVL